MKERWDKYPSKRNNRSQKEKYEEKEEGQGKGKGESEEELICGIHPVMEVLSHQSDRVEEVWLLEGGQQGVTRVAKKASGQKILSRYRPRSFFDRLFPDQNHQGVIVCLSQFEYVSLESLLEIGEDQAPLVWLAGVQDPGNVGSILRSARSFGAKGVILNQRDGCRVTPAVVRASAGAAASLPIAQIRNTEVTARALRKAGWWLLGLTLDETPIQKFDLKLPAVFIMGGEGKGLKPSVQKRCDALLSLPMASDWDSLNVSVCTGIVLYEWWRQQNV